MRDWRATMPKTSDHDRIIETLFFSPEPQHNERFDQLLIGGRKVLMYTATLSPAFCLIRH